MNFVELMSNLGAFRNLQTALREHAKMAFPVDCVVSVDASRYHGLGIVRFSDDCPPDQLPVLVESGNTWWYPLETITRHRDVTKWPLWIRRNKLPRTVLSR